MIQIYPRGWAVFLIDLSSPRFCSPQSLCVIMCNAKECWKKFAGHRAYSTFKKKGLPGDFGLSIWYVFSRSGPLESTFRFAGAFKGLFEGEVHIRKGEKSA